MSLYIIIVKRFFFYTGVEKSMQKKIVIFISLSCLAASTLAVATEKAKTYILQGLIENIHFAADKNGNNNRCYIAISDSNNNYYSNGYHFAARDICLMAQKAFILGLEVQAKAQGEVGWGPNYIVDMHYANRNACWPQAHYGQECKNESETMSQSIK